MYRQESSYALFHRAFINVKIILIVSFPFIINYILNKCSPYPLTTFLFSEQRHFFSVFRPEALLPILLQIAYLLCLL